MPSFNHSLISTESSNISFSNLSKLKFYAYNESVKNSNLKSFINNDFVQTVSSTTYIPMHLQQTNLDQMLNITSQQSGNDSNTTKSSLSSYSYSSSSGMPAVSYDAVNSDTNTPRERRPQFILTSREEEEILLAQFTDTDLSCYTSPPNSAIVNMELVCVCA